MEERQILPLHVCDSMFALEKIADEPVLEKDINKCFDILYDLTSQVLNAYAAGDEEMEYISIRKCMKLYKYINENKHLKTAPFKKALCLNKNVIKPRFVELQRSLTKRYERESANQHKLLLMSLKKPEPLDPAETTIDLTSVEEVDPELASFLKVLAEKNDNCLSAEIDNENIVNVDPFVIGLGRRKLQKALYIAKSFSQLECLSRSLEIPGLNFLECIERMCLLLSLRKIVRTKDLELDFILLSRYLTLNAMIRKMDDYHEKYEDYRSIIVKVVTIKNEYEEVRNLLIKRYHILETGLNLVMRLEKKENEVLARVEEIQKKKLNWISHAIKTA